MNAWSILIDILIIAFTGFGVWRGYKEGVFAASANLLGLAFALVLSYWLYQPVASVLLKIWTMPQSIANVFAFLLTMFVLNAVISGLVLYGSTKVKPQILDAELTHKLGIIPGFLSSLLSIGFTASLFTGLFSLIPSFVDQKTGLDKSILAPPLILIVNQIGAPADKLVSPAIADLTQLFTIKPDSKEIVDLKFSVQNPALDQPDEEGMLALINQERVSRGIKPVSMDERLRGVARAHSLDMFQRGYFSHYTPENKDPFDRIKAAGISYQSAGENIALAPSLSMAHTGLMNSPGHKRNILDPNYRKIGLGAYKDPRYGIMFSQEFTN